MFRGRNLTQPRRGTTPRCETVGRCGRMWQKLRAARAAGLALPLVVAACSPATESKPAVAVDPSVRDADGRPRGPLSVDDAGRYVLELVNRHRAQHGLGALEWDAPAASAGQRHADDMVRRGFTSHWGSDGSVPEQRYTEAGGVHLVRENAACFFDAVARELDPKPLFDPVELEKIQVAFYEEQPPNDGHRRNLLGERHTHFGVGLAKPLGVDQPCMAQQFTDHRGSYEALPLEQSAGGRVRVAGTLDGGVEFGGVGVSHQPPARAQSAEALNRTSSYRVPEPYEMYFPEGFRTPVPVRVQGQSFEVTVPLAHPSGAGRYGVSVWGRYPGAQDLVMVSLRTVRVP